jgi:hypothetical protein
MPDDWLIADGTRADAAGMVALDERNFARGDRFSARLWRTILDSTASGKMLTLVARQQGRSLARSRASFRRAPAG